MNPKLIVIYLTCHSRTEASNIGDALLCLRLIGCYNILGEIDTKYWWPPKENKFESAQEVVILLKTIPENFHKVETEVRKLHSDTTICLLGIPIFQVNDDYLQWIRGEIKSE